MQYIQNYPLIKTSLSDMRYDEIKMSDVKGKTRSNFSSLFADRVLKEGNKEIVSIIIDVEINTLMVKSPKKYEIEPSIKKREDEYNIDYKKIVNQKFYKDDGNRYIRKNYGAFTVEKPKIMNNTDVYKFAMYTLLDKKFNILSGETITAIGCKIIKLVDKKSKYHKMGNLKLESYLLNKQRPIKKHGQNTCVVDYIWDQVRGKHGFKRYTYEKLKN